MNGRAESSRSGARNVSGSSDDRFHRRSVSPDTRMTRLDSHSRSRSRSFSDASMSSRSPSPRRYTRHSPSASPRPSSHSTSKSAGKTALRIEHLTHNINESHLRHIFGWYGRIVRVYLTPSISAKEPSGWAYVEMSSVEEAAKAALYMSGGQIDGATLTVGTCVVPEDLPSRSEGRDRSGRDRRADSERWGRSDRKDRDRRASYDAPPPRSVHPDRQRMVGAVDRYAGRSSYGGGGAARPLRKWGQPDSNRGRDRSLSPPAPRRSSGATRGSPSY
ncbi:uncharacterized protein SPSC_04178 [Sporisorium scitamineum]|uniref:RRM domain-containing protein n=1 Tax=Sporisorium scitamineum TaxID=49012 RepID=A0A127Z3C3_9BASI|nr:uncharacterized protein SPSC_04178 [Sporisorium scitamineum]